MLSTIGRMERDTWGLCFCRDMLSNLGRMERDTWGLCFCRDRRGVMVTSMLSLFLLVINPSCGTVILPLECFLLVYLLFCCAAICLWNGRYFG